MDLVQVEKALKKEPRYRLNQVNKLLFQNLIEDWSNATVLPLPLREKLEKECPLEIKAESFISKDKKSVKAIISLKDDLKIESVLIRHKDKRNTVCVSSQVGCPLKCTFCATGKMGFKRNLEVSEIVEQVLFFARYLKKTKEKVVNIVFMGMGEPFLNYDNVLEAIRVLNNKQRFNLGARHFSISTIGIVPGIEKLAEEGMEINLAVSLHASDNELRSMIIPINEKYPLSKVLEAVDEYIKKTRRRVMFEYIMIKDVNDSNENARKLAKIAKKRLCFVNLIPYNPIDGDFKPSPPERINMFKEILEKRGVDITQRYRFGEDIKAACGQLASEEK